MKQKKLTASDYPKIHKQRMQDFIATRQVHGSKFALQALANNVASRIKRPTVSQFESDEKESGTIVALYNAIWIIASDILHDIGVKQIRTSYKTPK